MNGSAETHIGPRTSAQSVFLEQAAIRFRFAQCWIEKISTSAALIRPPQEEANCFVVLSGGSGSGKKILLRLARTL